MSVVQLVVPCRRSFVCGVRNMFWTRYVSDLSFPPGIILALACEPLLRSWYLLNCWAGGG